MTTSHFPMMNTSFESISISLATAEDIREWSYGEVKKPETINYRTLKPERDGLFCEKIFGPTRDWECSCGKYQRVRFKDVVCERCGVKVTRSRVRRSRMGHIGLHAPVTHIWYFKGVPSRLGYLLDLAPKDLEKVIYFAAYMITHVDEEARHIDLPRLEAELASSKDAIAKRRDAAVAERAKKMEADLAELEDEGAKADMRRRVREGGEREMTQIRKKADAEIDRLDRVFDRFRKLQVQDLEGDEMLYRSMREHYGRYFEGGKGAAAIKARLEKFDLEAEAARLREVIDNGKGARKTRALKRIKVVNAFRNSGTSPAAMVMDVIPVLPPDLRPMVQLDGGRFATSDLNDLYRRVINRNNRLKRLLDLNAPEIIVDNEKRMLQEAVDALFDNGRRGRPVTGPGNRPLKSLSDMLKGKQGRFRQNLLGKRVDYSGRSVIVAGPQLKLHQCGLPKQMALELFKPFVMKRLVELSYAQNIKSAKRKVERQNPEVWGVLEEVITEHPVLLNRAPTLHRLGIQAFEPQLIEGKAIQIHPLVCTAFNADFDGDQMAVHVPLSAEAQAEARILMLSTNNILSPADGRPIATPTQDMVLGIFSLTRDDAQPAANDEDLRVFASVSEAIMAYDLGQISLQEAIKVRLVDTVFTEGAQPQTRILVTTLGRALFNQALPDDFEYVNKPIKKAELSQIVNTLAVRYPKVTVATTLDALKDAGFHWATRSGVSISFQDVDVVADRDKDSLLGKAEDEAAKIEKQYDDGFIADSERKQSLIDIWTRTTKDVADLMEGEFKSRPTNPVWMMVSSGARGNMLQMRQIAGMRGLVANPKGEIIPRPIKSNFREGLSVLEYFISTHGARKGLADTALRTAESGYLTRRLVDVSQDVIIRTEDCGSDRGVEFRIVDEVLPDGSKEYAKFGSQVLVAVPTGGDSSVQIRSVPTALPQEQDATSLVSRCLAQDAMAGDTVVLPAGTDLGVPEVAQLRAAGVESVVVRSVLTCESQKGVCAKCYGRSLATDLLVDIGEAVGIIAAQSIGEPGTQLTMRTFHTGGAASAGGDITHGLPRIVEIFEARAPKGKVAVARNHGYVKITEVSGGKKITIEPFEPSAREQFEKDPKKFEYPVSSRSLIKVSDGDTVYRGQPLWVGLPDPNELLELETRAFVERYLVDEVQEVYRSQGVSIHDKHIEIIVRQMLRRVVVVEQNDSNMVEGDIVERSEYLRRNQETVGGGGKPASARAQLMGITKASLATESWLSAASFQETTRVLTEAAIMGKSDPLLGLKENVIIGKLIPAGTGLPRYREVRVEPTEEAKAAVYATMTSFDDFDYRDFGSGSGEAVRLDDYDLRYR